MGVKAYMQFIFFLSSLILLSGCNQYFEPLQENEKYYFSIYGYIDAAADTQWVRVGPARQDINQVPDPSGIKVTLEHLQSGQTTIMKDSLFAEKNFLNYWTTKDIKNEQTYRITVERNGKSSHVTVTTPEEIPAPYMTSSGRPPGYNVYIDNSVEHIADVQSVWFVTLNPENNPERRIYKFPVRHTLEFTGAFGESYFALANNSEEEKSIEQRIGSSKYSVERKQFFIAAGGPEWDDNISFTIDLEYFLHQSFTNVENGLGYVVGIDSKWFTQRTCLNKGRTTYVPCTPDDGPYWHRGETKQYNE